MGTICAAAVVSHQPGIMLPQEARSARGGRDTTLVAGFDQMRAALTAADVDTLVILDTHWFTTGAHVVAGQDRYQGIYTSDELPQLITDYAFDFPGAPDLAAHVGDVGRERELPVLNATNPHIAMQYPTLNLVHYLGQGEGVMRVSICQHAESHNFVQLGEVLAEAVARSDRRVAILASGGMSHRFPTLDNAAKHRAYSPEHVITPEARAFDEQVLAWWAAGDHAAVFAALPDYHQHKPEGMFGHYLAMAGALGGADWQAPGRLMSEYENALGTGQVHVWFDL